jgi:hypothetical protein
MAGAAMGSDVTEYIEKIKEDMEKPQDDMRNPDLYVDRLEELKEVLEKINQFKIEITSENVQNIKLMIQRVDEDRVSGVGRMLGPRDRLAFPIPLHVIAQLNETVSEWLHRSGGVVESAGGKFMRPIVMKEAQANYDDMDMDF